MIGFFKRGHLGINTQLVCLQLTRNSSEVFVVDDMDDPTPDNDSLDAPDSNWIPLGTPTVMMRVGTAATSGLVNVPYRSETVTLVIYFLQSLLNFL